MTDQRLFSRPILARLLVAGALFSATFMLGWLARPLTSGVAAAGQMTPGHEPPVASMPGDESNGMSMMPSGEQASDRRRQADREVLYWRAPMDPAEVYEAPGKSRMGMDLVPVYAEEAMDATGAVRISPVTMQNIGVRTERVRIESLPRRIRTTGHVVMDEQGEHTVSLRISGWVESLFADFDGARIHAGDPLLAVYSPELVTTQEEYLMAVRTAADIAPPANAGAARLAEAALRRLRFWGMSEDQIDLLRTGGVPLESITYHAPVSGEIMNHRVSEGQFVQAGGALMDIIDLTRNWLIVELYEQDVAWVREGTPARVEFPFLPGKAYRARVDYVYHMMDPGQRTARARIVLPGGHKAAIKPGMYGLVYLSGDDAPPAPTVPEESLIRNGEETVVIVAEGEGRFRPVQITLGAVSGGRAQVLEGLAGTEEVVTSAQFLIDSEAQLKSAILAMTDR